VQQVYLWYTVVFQIDSILQRIVTNKRSMLLILNNYVSRNLEVGLMLHMRLGSRLPNLAFTVQEEGLGVPRIAPLRDRRLVKQSSGADWPTR
jgi:hypothetical protein